MKNGTGNLETVVELYDPHPGLAGALMHIPKKVKEVADALNGQKVSLRVAVERIQAVTSGAVTVAWAHDFIDLEIDSGIFSHSWVVLKYRKVK